MRSTIHEEDATVLDSLGPVSDRENENLSVIDGGVTSLRDLYLRQIEAVRAGKDPIGVVRAKEENELIVIGINYQWVGKEVSLGQMNA